MCIRDRSIAEVSVAMMQDRFRLSRRAAVLVILLPLLLFSSLCSLSFGSLSDFRVFGMTIFELLDSFTTDILLPLGSMAVCIYLGWFAPKTLLADELSNNGALRSPLTPVVLGIVRYLAPVLIALILVFNYI